MLMYNVHVILKPEEYYYHQRHIISHLLRRILFYIEFVMLKIEDY